MKEYNARLCFICKPGSKVESMQFCQLCSGPKRETYLLHFRKDGPLLQHCSACRFERADSTLAICTAFPSAPQTWRREWQHLVHASSNTHPTRYLGILSIYISNRHRDCCITMNKRRKYLFSINIFLYDYLAYFKDLIV